MSDQIFRKKSLDRISSPEQLNDYIRVANPGIWMIRAAVIIVLGGVCGWGVGVWGPWGGVGGRRWGGCAGAARSRWAGGV